MKENISRNRTTPRCLKDKNFLCPPSQKILIWSGLARAGKYPELLVKWWIISFLLRFMIMILNFRLLIRSVEQKPSRSAAGLRPGLVVQDVMNQWVFFPGQFAIGLTGSAVLVVPVILSECQGETALPGLDSNLDTCWHYGDQDTC